MSIDNFLNEEENTDIVECDLDIEANREFLSVLEMLKEARKYHLEVEVVYSFGNERASGVPIEQACANALYEWDI